jgi:hypothetical protein
MGDDSVMECINEAGSVRAYSSWTTVSNGKFDAQRSGVVSYKHEIVNVFHFYELLKMIAHIAEHARFSQFNC